MKANHYYIHIFLTPDGKIYVDYSSRNKENEVIFCRIDANDIENKPKEREWNIINEIKKIHFYLQKDGLKIADAPIEMIYTSRSLSDSLREKEYYYFVVVEKSSKFLKNDNVILLDLEDFLSDKEINSYDKKVVEKFFNSQASEK